MARTGMRSFGALAVAGLLVGVPASTMWAAADEMAATETAVTIPAVDHDIVGTLALPAEADGPVPAVLMLHGYGSSADEVGDMYGRLADALAAQGVGSLRIDFAGMGASPATTLEYTYRLDDRRCRGGARLARRQRSGGPGARRCPGLQPRLDHRRPSRRHGSASGRVRLLVGRYRGR